MFLPKNKRRIKVAHGHGIRKTAVTILCFTAILFTHSSITAQTHPAKESIRFRVMSWNVENLFDTRHDTLKNDNEFLPEAHRHWNNSRYNKKLADIAAVITTVGQWNAPALVALCEVENDSVLRDLTLRSPLKKLNYHFVMTDSPDLRGIDVALLYQRDLFKRLSHRSIPIPPLSGYRPTRDLLHVSGLLMSGDTLDVFVCHFPSRSGGAKESEPYRLHAAKKLRAEVDSLLKTRFHPLLIIMGDFNDYPSNKSIQEVLKAVAPPSTPTTEITPSALYHLLARPAKSRNFGSYKYQGEWGLLDHLIVSGTLLDTSSHLFTSEEKATVARLSFLLTEDEKYGGDEPFRTYKGMKYQGGISDHLPVYTDFTLTPQ